jgi:hypothetical protein
MSDKQQKLSSKPVSAVSPPVESKQTVTPDEHEETSEDNKSLGGSEYEEIDLTENPLYQVLSAFFENEEGENLCDHISKLTSAIENNTKMMETLLKKTLNHSSSPSSSSSKK